MIILPTMQWSVGKPNVQIRKASIVCCIKLLEQKLIEPEKLYPSFKNLVNTLKNCLDDDWQNDIRFASVVLCRHLLTYLCPTSQFDREDYIHIYPELLKRLDDAQDGIRIETCKVFEVFF